MSDFNSPDPGGLARAAALFVVAMAAVFGMIGLARDETGGTELLDPPAASASPSPSPSPTATAPTSEPSTSETASPTATPSETAPAIDPADVTIQVLDATTSTTATDQVVADLREAGYDVQAVGSASRTYEQTTVFYTVAEGNKEAAEQIAAEFGWDVVQEKLDNLSDSVRVHIVVGEDA